MPANLSAGESVLNAGATKKMGKTEIDRRNKEGEESATPSGVIERLIVGTSPGQILRNGKGNVLHLTADTPFPVGSRFEFETDFAEGSLKMTGRVLKSGRDGSKRGTDVSIEDYRFSAMPQAPKPILLGDDPAPFHTTPAMLRTIALQLQGWTNKMIARKFGCGEHYLKNLTRQFYDLVPGDEIRTRMELLIHAQEDGGVLRKAANSALQEWEREHPKVERERVA